MNDYDRIEAVIRHLDENFQEQPDLTRLAQRAGLSPFHFHRLFSSWAGVTPKDFLQCLTLSEVKKQLREGKSVLAASLDSGLSGPGRLHDLCVELEAASPGEIKSGGEGWTLTAGFAESPFGKCLIAESPRGICHLSFTGSERNDSALAGIQKQWPRAGVVRNDAHAAKLSKKIFVHSRQTGMGSVLLRAFVKGTDFQVRVWRALLNVRPGTLVTYGDLARAVKKPSAARAVGTAVGDNPVAFLIPCHRVIRETGVTGEYHWGRTRKQLMIGWENVRK